MKWKDVPGYEGCYKANFNGDIKGLNKRSKTNRETILKPFKNKFGYLTIQLSKNDKKTHYGVHRIIALTFIENHENKPFVNHKDGNKANNHVDNLEWCTKSENEKHAHAIGLKNWKGQNHSQSKLTNEDVHVIRMLISNGIRNKKIAALFDLDNSTISDIKRGKIWSHLKQISSFSIDDMRKCWDDGVFNGVWNYQQNKSKNEEATFNDFMKEEYNIDITK